MSGYGDDGWMKVREQVTVLIVGGGPCGLTSALLLEQAGIDFVLLERRDFKTRIPRAHLLNVRTWRSFTMWAWPSDIYARARRRIAGTGCAGTPRWTGPSEVHGRKIGDVHAWGGGPDRDRYAIASPRAFANLPQIRLDALLWDHAQGAALARSDRIRRWWAWIRTSTA